MNEFLLGAIIVFVGCLVGCFLVIVPFLLKLLQTRNRAGEGYQFSASLLARPQINNGDASSNRQPFRNAKPQRVINIPYCPWCKQSGGTLVKEERWNYYYHAKCWREAAEAYSMAHGDHEIIAGQ